MKRTAKIVNILFNKFAPQFCLNMPCVKSKTVIAPLGVKRSSVEKHDNIEKRL